MVVNSSSYVSIFTVEQCELVGRRLGYRERAKSFALCAFSKGQSFEMRTHRQCARNLKTALFSEDLRSGARAARDVTLTPRLMR